MTHILEDLTHKMEGQPPKKGCHLGSRYVCIYIYMYVFVHICEAFHPLPIRRSHFHRFYLGPPEETSSRQWQLRRRECEHNERTSSAGQRTCGWLPLGCGWLHERSEMGRFCGPAKWPASTGLSVYSCYFLELTLKMVNSVK